MLVVLVAPPELVDVPVPPTAPLLVAVDPMTLPLLMLFEAEVVTAPALVALLDAVEPLVLVAVPVVVEAAELWSSLPVAAESEHPAAKAETK